MQETWVPSLVQKILWRRKWPPTPVFFPGEFHEQRNLAGCSPWGCKESGTTERLHFTIAHQAPLSMEISKQEYWSGLPFPAPGDPPRPETEPTSPALPGRFFTAEAPGKPLKKKKKIVVDLSNRILCQSGSQQKSKSHISKVIEHLIIALFTK